jgi:alcohol dehydrogenase
MKAVVFYQHGGIDKLVFEPDYPDPQATPDQVRIRVRAVALNYFDIFSRRGMPSVSVPLPMITGGDIAGEVEQAGAEVTGWKPGDRVVVNPLFYVDGRMRLMGETAPGGLCGLVCVRPDQLIALPGNVSFEQAAALPVAYGTAQRMMVTRGQVAADDRVLILGASGGVGTACVQIAKRAGAEVVACASSSEKLERLRELGADHGINYAEDDMVEAVHQLYGKPRITGGGGVTMVINFTGGDTWVPSLKCLGPKGRLLTCGATAGFDPQTDIRYIWSFEHNILGSNAWTRDDLETMLHLVASGDIEPVIDSVQPLEQTADAEGRLERREILGKVILTP